MSWRALKSSALVGIVFATACDSQPSGPGALGAAVIGSPSAAAVILEVRGPGILGFDGDGGTQAFAAVVSEAEGRHRVILVGSGAGELRFKIRVSERDTPPIVASVIQAVGADNHSMVASGLQVRIAR
jgi:hypothetical protein